MPFPADYDTLTRVSADDYLDTPGKEGDVIIGQIQDAIEAMQAAIGKTGETAAGTIEAQLAAVPATIASLAPAETPATIGATISGAAQKTTPADSDKFPASDSAAGGVLKWFSWADIKAALKSIFATLAGVAGGQTLFGGTEAGETLTLRSTAHATKGKILFGSSSAFDEVLNDWGFGTTNPSATTHVLSTTEQQRLGYDAANYLSATVSSGGVVTYSATGGQYIFRGINSTATLGSDLVTNGTFDTDLSGWTDSGSNWSWTAGVAYHAPGAADTLSQNITVTSGSTYLVEITLSARTAGSVQLNLGSVPLTDFGTTISLSTPATYRRTLVAGASGSVSLSLIPTSAFDGSVDSIKVRNVTLGSVTATLILQNSDGSTGFQMRSGGATQWNTFIGTDAGRSVSIGYNNSALGANALRAVTTALNNTAIGYNALNVCTIGSLNTAVGSGAGQAVSSGYGNSLLGYQAGALVSTGMYNSAFGSNTLSAMVSGGYNTAIGYSSMTGTGAGSNNSAYGGYAGRYIADGTTANATCDNSVFIGHQTKALASGQTNQTVIGYNATGLGSNTTVIGSSATLKFKAFGTPILTPAASSVPTVNGELTVEATSNTSLTFRLKGTDGTVRSASLTLS